MQARGQRALRQAGSGRATALTEAASLAAPARAKRPSHLPARAAGPRAELAAAASGDDVCCMFTSSTVVGSRFSSADKPLTSLKYSCAQQPDDRRFSFCICVKYLGLHFTEFAFVLELLSDYRTLLSPLATSSYISVSVSDCTQPKAVGIGPTACISTETLAPSHRAQVCI